LWEKSGKWQQNWGKEDVLFLLLALPLAANRNSFLFQHCTHGKRDEEVLILGEKEIGMSH
jgi:hypothetical protein